MFNQGIAEIGSRATSITESSAAKKVTKVKINVGEKDGKKQFFTSGTDGGRTIEIDNPFGSQAMADSILAKMQGYVHRSVSADGVKLDPRAEPGDAISLKGNLYGLYGVKQYFDSGMRAQVSSGGEDTAESEFPAVPHRERKTDRHINSVSRGVGAANKRMDQMDSDYEFDRKQIYARISNAEGGLDAIVSRDKREQLTEAKTTLYAEIYDDETGIPEIQSRLDLVCTKDDKKKFKESTVSLYSQVNDPVTGLPKTKAGLDLLADEDQLEGLRKAKTTLYAQLNDPETGLVQKAATIELSVKKVKDDVESLVEIKTDLLNLVTVATISEGKLYAKKGLSVVGASNFVGDFTLSGGSTLSVLGGSKIKTPSIEIDKKVFASAKTITSADGNTYTVLST